MRFVVVLVVLLISRSPSTLAWDGYNELTGANVEIQSGNLVREGEDVEIYDYDTGNYRDIEIQDIDTKYDGDVEIEAYDYTTGEYIYLEMEGK